MRWVGHLAHMGEWKGVYRVLVGKPEGKKTLGRPRHRWEGNIKMDLQEVGCGGYGLDRAGLGLGLLAGICERGNEVFFFPLTQQPTSGPEPPHARGF